MNPRAWFVAAWVCLAVLAGVALWATSTCIALCRATVSQVAEPAGWREWPRSDRSVLCAGACPDVPYSKCDVAQLLSGGESVGLAWDRHEPGTDLFVIAGPPWKEEAPREHCWTALRRTTGWRVMYRADNALVVLPSLGLALAAMTAGFAVARRRLRAGSGLLTSEHDTRAALASGAPTYRVSPAPPGPPPSIQARLAATKGARGARRAIVVALVAVLAIFGLTVVLAIILALSAVRYSTDG
jgi:hypothetical protein